MLRRYKIRKYVPRKGRILGITPPPRATEYFRQHGCFAAGRQGRRGGGTNKRTGEVIMASKSDQAQPGLTALFSEINPEGGGDEGRAR